MLFKTNFIFVTVFAVTAALAQDTASARAAYQQQQAVQEVQRLAQQFDQIVENQDAIVSRLQKVETSVSSAGDTSDLRAEIAALKASIAELRREQESMRREIVSDLSKRIASMPRPAAATPPPPAPSSSRTTSSKAASYEGSYYEHVVESGQTLSMIAKGFDTTVSKIRQANNLKNDVIRVGQKLIIPAEGK
jgi:LysM repeat protein